MMHDSPFNNVAGLPIKTRKVTIEEQAYLGGNSTVLCGVTIGGRAVVGAGSVVVRDVPDEAVAFGCLGTVKGTLAEFCARYTRTATDPDRYQYLDLPAWRVRQEAIKKNTR